MTAARAGSYFESPPHIAPVEPHVKKRVTLASELPTFSPPPRNGENRREARDIGVIALQKGPFSSQPTRATKAAAAEALRQSV
jgi:hypothetical protein